MQKVYILIIQITNKTYRHQLFLYSLIKLVEQHQQLKVYVLLGIRKILKKTSIQYIIDQTGNDYNI